MYSKWLPEYYIIGEMNPTIEFKKIVTEKTFRLVESGAG